MDTGDESGSRQALAQLVVERREDILKRWMALERSDVVRARRLTNAELRDHLPMLLDTLGRELGDGRAPLPAFERHAEDHADDRIVQGFDLEEAVREFQLLRHVIARVAAEGECLDLSVLEALNEAVDRAVLGTIRQFERSRADDEQDARRFRLALRHSHTAVFEQGPDLVYRWIYNPGLGFAARDVRGKTDAELLEPGDAARLGEMKRQVVRTSTPAVVTLKTSHGGVDSTFLLALEPLTSGTGEALGLVGAATDISQQVQAEARLTEALSTLNAVLSASPIAFALFDPSMRYVRINAKLAELHGLPPGDHLGKSIFDVLPRERAEPIARDVKRVLETGEVVQTPLEQKSAEGEPLTLLASYYPVREPGGALLGVAKIVLDLTEQKRAERALRQTAELRERLLGVVSHDLRNSLQAITLSARALAGQPLGEKPARAVGRIESSAARMNRLIAELLDFVRGSIGGGIPVTLAPTDVGELCGDVVEEVRHAHPKRTIAYDVEGDTHADVDGGRIGQVVTNLVVNALRHGSGDGAVTVRVAGTPDAVRIEVHNLGEPVPTEQLAHLFEPFWSGSKRSTAREGLGLGLFIVSEIVKAHRGRIRVDSTREAGTTFTVELPRNGRGAQPAEQASLA